jgi:membrane-associated protease RseP (regulator of RpoE activity)
MGSTCHRWIFIAGSLALGLPAVVFGQDDATRTLVASLGSEDFKERIKAQQELSRWALERPEIGGKWLLKESESTGEPEVRIRLREVLKEVVIAEHQKDGPGYVGIGMWDVEVEVPGQKGLRAGVSVTRVQDDTPASRAGLKAGDVVVSLDKLKWTGEAATTQFQKAVMERKPGDIIELEILRGEELIKVPVTLAPRPMGLPEVSAAPAVQGFQRFPGLRMNFLQLGEEEQKALDEKMKADEKKAKEDCFQRWLEEHRGNVEKP